MVGQVTVLCVNTEQFHAIYVHGLMIYCYIFKKFSFLSILKLFKTFCRYYLCGVYNTDLQYYVTK